MTRIRTAAAPACCPSVAVSSVGSTTISLTRAAAAAAVLVLVLVLLRLDDEIGFVRVIVLFGRPASGPVPEISSSSSDDSEDEATTTRAGRDRRHQQQRRRARSESRSATVLVLVLVLLRLDDEIGFVRVIVLFGRPASGESDFVVKSEQDEDEDEDGGRPGANAIAASRWKASPLDRIVRAAAAAASL
jgi:hypothetical protein